MKKGVACFGPIISFGRQVMRERLERGLFKMGAVERELRMDNFRILFSEQLSHTERRALRFPVAGRNSLVADNQMGARAERKFEKDVAVLIVARRAVIGAGGHFAERTAPLCADKIPLPSQADRSPSGKRFARFQRKKADAFEMRSLDRSIFAR